MAAGALAQRLHPGRYGAIDGNPFEQSPAFPRQNKQVRAERVEVACEYQEACALTQRIFGGPLSVTRFFAQPELTQMYAAWLGKDLVAAATRWPFGGTAGLYSVGTEPHLRRQGMRRR
jgi:hypothetical protein